MPVECIDANAAQELIAGRPLSLREAGKLLNCSKDTIANAIKDLPPQEIIRSYKDQRADSLAGLQVKLLNAIDDDKLKKASAFQLVGSAALLYDKERLERGQATSISAVDIRQLIASVSVDTPEDMGVDMGVSGKDVTQNK
jgi:ParB-like chromosome segregation protein Spo0J